MKQVPTWLCLGVCLVLGSGGREARAGLIAGFSHVSVEAIADADRLTDPADPNWVDPTFASDYQFKDQFGTLAPLTISALATQTAYDVTATAGGTSDLTFTSSEAGTVTLSSNWDVTGQPQDGQDARVSVSHLVYYEFTVSGTGLFLDVDALVTNSGSGSTFGMTNYGFELSSDVSYEDHRIDNTWGNLSSVHDTFSLALVDGRSYRFAVYAFPNVSGGIFGTSVQGVGKFDFQVRQGVVPEPSTLVLAGLGVIGFAAMRSRRGRSV